MSDEELKAKPPEKAEPAEKPTEEGETLSGFLTKVGNWLWED
jgi:hypothetical protein